jgi:hypothetical protein
VSDARYVIAGLARPRVAWFSDLSLWANAGTLPIEFVKCIGQQDLLSRIDSGRAFSAVVFDAGLPGIDRDVLARSSSTGALVIAVEDPRIRVDWAAAGADVVLAHNFTAAEFLDGLATRARLIPRVEATAVPQYDSVASPVRGHMVAVTGSGGVGTSTVAMAAAQAGGGSSHFRDVVLADFCMSAEQAMLHDTQSVTPGIQELVEAHRSSTLDPEKVRGLCFAVEGRHYDLLLGLRRRRFWTTIRANALTAAINSLTNSYDLVIADCDEDLEGETETGSVDIEERNVLARTGIRNADTVLVVGSASLKGLHTLTRVLSDIREFGVADHMLQPVINIAPSNGKARAAYTRALHELLGEQTQVAPPIFLPFQHVDEALRANASLPTALTEPLTGFLEHRARGGAPLAKTPRWKRLRAGFLNSSNAESVA